MMVYLFYFPSIMFLFSYHFLSRFPGVKYTVLVQSCMYLCSIIIIYHNRSSHDDFVSIYNRNTSIVLLHIIDLMRPTIAWWELFTAITFHVQHDGHSPFRLSAYVACSCTIQCPFSLYLAAQSRYPTICFCFSLLYAKPLIRGFAGIASCKVISCAICHTMADFIIFFVQQITDLSLDSVRC